jgi:hypothetical protein
MDENIKHLLLNEWKERRGLIMKLELKYETEWIMYWKIIEIKRQQRVKEDIRKKRNKEEICQKKLTMDIIRKCTKEWKKEIKICKNMRTLSLRIMKEIKKLKEC